MTGRPSVMFYCQHSLGMGHLVRSLALAAGLSASFRVILLNGGPLPKGIRLPTGVDVIDLPPLGLNANGELVSRDRRRTVERARALRRKIILETFRDLRPAILFIELYPFGRKKFGYELMPLLEEARGLGPARPLVVCGLRDILVGRAENQQKYDDRAATLANDYFDLILVHSDPTFARLEESFHARTRLRIPVNYTGFIVPPEKRVADPKCDGRFKKILVSTGGGMVGEELLRAAIQSHTLFLQNDGFEMNIVAGPFLPERPWRALQALAMGNGRLRLRRHVSDLCGEMRKASASVSQCGYNTTLDILRSGVPALVVPFAAGNEDEQSKRAMRLRDLGAIRVLEERDMNPERLAVEIRELLEFRASRPALDLDGVRKSVRILKSMIGTAKSAPVTSLSESTNRKREHA